jgi:hypothetical protein
VQFSFMRIDEQARKFYFEHQFNNLLYLLRAALFLTVHTQFLFYDNMADRWRSTYGRLRVEFHDVMIRNSIRASSRLL